MTHRLDTWEGTLTISQLDELLDRVAGGVFVGQRAGDFTLGLELPGGAAKWASGRCFNEALEVRWWPGADGESPNALALNSIPQNWVAPPTLQPMSNPLDAPAKLCRYLCIGKYDEGSPKQVPTWWESRVPRSFHYLSSAPPGPAGGISRNGRERGRVYLRAVVYELKDGRTQHRLTGFEHAGREEPR